MDQTTPRWLAPALLIAATALVHANGAGNGFVWDDASIVVENPDTRDLSRLGHVLLSPDETPPYYRPLNRASYLVDYQLFGMDARGYHAVNMLLQAACALAMYALGRRVFEARWPALLAGLLLAVHPLHTEAVAFVSARNNLFALIFGLLSLALFIDAARLRSWGRSALSAVAFFLALASKEQGAMVLPLLAAWILLPVFPGQRARRDRWKLLLPHSAALLAYAVLRTIALGGPVASTGILQGLGERLAQNWFVLPAYLRLAVFPRGLTVFHEVPAEFARVGWLPFAWVFILAALVYLVRRPSVASTLGLLWFALNLLPIVNIIPIPSTVMAERFFHASAAGLWLVAADAAWRLSRVVPRRGVLAVAAVVVAALGVRTLLRNRDWSDDVTLFRSAVRADGGSLLAHFNLGVALKDAGDLDGARREWEAALAIKPDDPGTHAQLGTALAVQGDLAAAESHYRAALRGNPRLAEARFNLGRICERTGRFAEARGYYEGVLEGPPPPDAALASQARERLTRLGQPPSREGSVTGR